MTEPPISTVFSLIADLAKALGVTGIGEMERPWEYRLGQEWEVAVNGKNEAVKWRIYTLEPFSFIGLRNDFPVILGHPYGGAVMGHGPEIEDELIECLTKAIKGAA